MGSINTAALILCALAPTLHAQADTTRPNAGKWWSEPPVWKSPYSTNAKRLPRIRVSGNHFVDAQGHTILFRGFAISDPDKIQDQGQWNKRLFEQLRATGATLIRIPVHPVAWRARTPEGYLVLLDQAVEWATDNGLYLIIDWHSIGNLNDRPLSEPDVRHLAHRDAGFLANGVSAL